MMQKFSKGSITGERIGLYLIAGVGTAPGFLQQFQERLAERLIGEGNAQVYGELQYPYGDWGAPLRSQVMQVWHDIRLSPGRLERSIGGKAVLKQVVADGQVPERLLFIGHSGGGTAALHAAALLRQMQAGQDVLVIQIGSPRSPVPPLLQPNTAYFYACKQSGSGKDPICRLGSWRSGEGQHAWRIGRKSLYEPGEVIPLQIAGGHPDYFRTSMVNDEGLLNMDVTLSAVWEYVKQQWHT
jgi:hypothetical protein